MANATAHQDPLSGLYFEKKESWRKRIAGGIACSCIATAIFQFAHIKSAVLYACDGVGYMFGKPLTGDGGVVKKVENKLTKIEKTIEEKAHNIPVIPAHMPTLHKTPEQLEAEARLKEEKEKRQSESKLKIVIAKLETLGVPFDRDASLEKLQVELTEAEEMHRKRPLLDHADNIGLRVDPKEPYETLAKQIKEAEIDADYQEQVRQYEKNLAYRQKMIESYNARCPNSRCRRPFKTMAKSGNFRCPKCSGIYTPAQARANWTVPPEPPHPKRKTGVMDRVKGLFGR